MKKKVGGKLKTNWIGKRGLIISLKKGGQKAGKILATVFLNFLLMKCKKKWIKNKKVGFLTVKKYLNVSMMKFLNLNG